MPRPRDSQRAKVYAWEHQTTIAGQPELSLVECGELVRRVWAAYRPGTHPPRILDGRGTSAARGGSSYINLPRWSRTRCVVLHEAAHSILADAPYAWHGPEWLRLQIELLARLAGFQRADLLRSARAAGLHVARSVPCRPMARLRASGTLRPPRCAHEWEGTGLERLERRRRGARLFERRVYDEFHCRRCGERVSKEKVA